MRHRRRPRRSCVYVPLLPQRYYRSPFVDWERTMGTKLEQWRQADRQAHSAELWLYGFGRGRDSAPAADVAAAKGLREVADRLFDEAMAELQAEITDRVAGRRDVSGSH